MLKVFDPLEEYFETLKKERPVPELNYYASELIDYLELADEQELELALERAFQVCSSLHISIEDNFKQVFRFDGQKLYSDWQLSSLACYMITINGNPIHPKVARAQVFFALQHN